MLISRLLALHDKLNVPKCLAPSREASQSQSLLKLTPNFAQLGVCLNCQVYSASIRENVRHNTRKNKYEKIKYRKKKRRTNFLRPPITKLTTPRECFLISLSGRKTHEFVDLVL